MRSRSRGRFLAGSLLAAAALFAAGSASGATQQIITDDPDLEVPEKRDTIRSESGKENGTADKGSGDGTSDGSAAEAADAPDTGGELAKGDPLYGFPRSVTARAIRGDSCVRLRGAFWLAYPDPAQQWKFPADTIARREGALLTLRALELSDTAHHRQIRLESIRLYPEVTAVKAQFPPTVHVDARGIPVYWTAKVWLPKVRSGTYRGSLLAVRADDSIPRRPPVVIPLVVFVKDSPWPAVIILVLGVGLAMGLRWYRDSVRARDEAYVRIEDGERLIVSDRELTLPGGVADPFRRRFASHLRAAAGALDDRSWTLAASRANAELDRADELWVEWQKGRAAWLAALEQERAEIHALETFADTRPSSLHVRALLQVLRDGYDEAPSHAVPEGTAAPPPDGGDAPGGDTTTAPGAVKAYRAAAAARAALVVRYRELVSYLNVVRDEAQTLQDAIAKQKLLAALDRVQKEWDAFGNPTNQTASDETLTKLRTAVETARNEAGLGAREPEPQPEPENAADATAPNAGYEDPNGAELVPRHFRPRLRVARTRSRVYTLVLILVVLLALAVLGFTETWLDDPDFGANWVKDYATVFAWALGINALGLANLTTISTQWPLPWVRRSAPNPPPADTSARDGGAEADVPAGWMPPRLRRL